MPAQQNDAPQTGPRRSDTRRLGPYETAYDVRRGYEAGEVPRGLPSRRDLPDPVWVGRRRDE